MLSIGRLGAGAADYHVSAVATGAEDYYLREGEQPGRWLGGGEPADVQEPPGLGFEL